MLVYMTIFSHRFWTVTGGLNVFPQIAIGVSIQAHRDPLASET